MSLYKYTQLENF